MRAIRDLNLKAAGQRAGRARGNRWDGGAWQFREEVFETLEVLLNETLRAQ